MHRASDDMCHLISVSVGSRWVHSAFLTAIPALKNRTTAKTFRQLSNDLRMEWSLELGFNQFVPLRDSKQAFTDLLKKGPCSASSDHIAAQLVHLRWSLDLPSEIRFMPALLLTGWRDARESVDVFAEAALLVEKYEKIMLHIWDSAKLLLLPIWASGLKNDAAHWTLLALEKGSDEIAVRYYDTLLQPSCYNLSFADAVLNFLKVPAQIEVTNRSS